jgi:hypothetical protein
MKNSIDFYQVFSAELFKTRNNLAKWLLLLFPLCFSTLIFIYFFFKVEMIPHNPWLFTGNKLFGFYSFFYPLLIAFTVSSLIHIEYKHLGFKHLFTVPAPLSYMYMAKILVLFLYIFYSTVVAYISYKFGCILLQISRPELHFRDYDSSWIINLFFLKFFLSLICISLIQFTLSLRFPNFIVSVSIALFFTMFPILFDFEYAYLIPYKNISMAYTDCFLEDYTFFKKEVVAALIYIPVFFVAGGYFLFKKRQNGENGQN